MFILDFRNIIVILSIAIHVSLLWVLYRYGRKTPGGKAYSVAILAIAGWILPMALYRSNLFGQMLLWARVLYVMASFTSTSFLFFTFIFPDDKKVSWRVQAILLVENVLIVLLCLHPTLMIRGVEIVPGREARILWGPLYFVYSLHISALFLAGFVILFLKMRRAGGLVRQQIKYILGGYFLGANLAMTTNLVLPWFGYFELNWLGQFFSTLVAAFTTYAILKYRLLYIKLITTEGFVILLNLALFVQLVLSDSPVKLALNALVLAAVLLVSIWLVRSVRKEITAREEVTTLARSLKAANLKLQEIDRQKTDFLSIAAHQLRTPLSVINGYIELIKEGDYGQVTDETKGVLDNMDESNERLVKLVDEFLDITRIEQGRTKFDFKKQSIAAVVASAVAELKDRARQKNLKLQWRPAPLPPVLIDEEKIRMVVFNFIDNAIKYSEKGAITVAAETEDRGIAVRVADHGLGFEKTDAANFFQKFYRGNNVKGADVTGTGLGLYVCQKFIEAHQGKIWAKSPGLGKGSEFGFWIPREHAGAPPPASPASSSTVV